MSETTTTGGRARKAGYDYDRDALRSKLTGVDRTPGSSKPDPILTVDNVVRRFGGMTAVDVGHVEVQRGAITALIGPNGAGKTTFFNLLTGFDKASSAPSTFKRGGDTAKWVFDGKPMGNVGAAKVARAGMVRTFQLTKALSRLTVLQNMLSAHATSPARTSSSASSRRSGRPANARSRQRPRTSSSASSSTRRRTTTPAASLAASGSCSRWPAPS